MRYKTCFFTGHRRILTIDELRLHSKINAAVRDLYAIGVTHFISGGATGFDMLAAEAVAGLKKSFGDIKLSLYLPCENHTEKWYDSDISRFKELLKSADEVKYTKKAYDAECMRLRNQAMVLDSAYCITYFENRPGGTMQTIAMAKKMNCTIRNLAKERW